MRLDFDDEAETWIPVEWVDEQLGGREEEVDGGKADHLGGGTDSDQLVWDWSGNINCGLTAW